LIYLVPSFAPTMLFYNVMCLSSLIPLIMNMVKVLQHSVNVRNNYKKAAKACLSIAMTAELYFSTL